MIVSLCLILPTVLTIVREIGVTVTVLSLSVVNTPPSQSSWMATVFVAPNSSLPSARSG